MTEEQDTSLHYRQLNKSILRLFETKQGKEDLNQALVFIQAGGTPRTAFANIGIKPATFHNWMKRGLVETDTEYSELYAMVHSVLAQCTLSKEIQLAEDDPKHYLTKGVGRYFHSHVPGEKEREIVTLITGDVVQTTGDTPVLSTDYDPENQQAKLESHDDKETQRELIESLIEMKRNGVDMNVLIENLAVQEGIVEDIETVRLIDQKIEGDQE